jgi:hypothetical protein
VCPPLLRRLVDTWVDIYAWQGAMREKRYGWQVEVMREDIHSAGASLVLPYEGLCAEEFAGDGFFVPGVVVIADDDAGFVALAGEEDAIAR